MPENGERFTVEIFSSQDIRIIRSTTSVTVLPSSLSVFQFAQASRYNITSNTVTMICVHLFNRAIVVTDANTVQLQVERIRGVPIEGEVSIFTRSPNSAFTYEGVTIQPAIGAEHYATTSDTIRMNIGEVDT